MVMYNSAALITKMCKYGKIKATKGYIIIIMLGLNSNPFIER